MDITEIKDFGKIDIINCDGIETNTCKKLVYVPKHNKSIECDIIDVVKLNELLIERNEYIIAGLYGGRMAMLITNAGSLISRVHYKLCQKCKEKWKHQIYTEGKICECDNMVKRDCMITVLWKGTIKLRQEQISFIKKLFSERACSTDTCSIFKRSHGDIIDDVEWCNELYEFIKIIPEHIFNDTYRTLVDENKMLTHQIDTIRCENDTLHTRIDRLRADLEKTKMEDKTRDYKLITDSNHKFVELNRVDKKKCIIL